VRTDEVPPHLRVGVGHLLAQVRLAVVLTGLVDPLDGGAG
jgi:hypothetical protein